MARKRSSSSREASSRTPRGISSQSSSSSGGFVDARRLRPQSNPLSQAAEEDSQGRLGLDLPGAARQAQRQADARRTRRRRIWAGVVSTVVLLALALVLIVLYAPAFRVTAGSISVTGTNRWVDRSVVVRTADQAVGRSIARVDTQAIKAGAMKAGAVASVSVTRRLPNRVIVRVVPLVPREILHDTKNRYTLVDGNGKVISHLSSKVSGVPLIEVQDATAGTDRPILRQTLAVLAAMPSSLSKRMDKVSAATRDSVTTVTTDGYTVIWGDSQDMRLKCAIVEHLLGSSQMGQNRTIDVSSPQRPVLKK